MTTTIPLPLGLDVIYNGAIWRVAAIDMTGGPRTYWLARDLDQVIQLPAHIAEALETT
jgi:hypothetical protein